MAAEWVVKHSSLALSVVTLLGPLVVGCGAEQAPSNEVTSTGEEPSETSMGEGPMLVNAEPALDAPQGGASAGEVPLGDDDPSPDAPVAPANTNPPVSAEPADAGGAPEPATPVLTPAGPPQACGEQVFPLVRTVPTLLLLLDRTSSMNDGNKWEGMTSGVLSFVQSPDTANLRVGLRFYPDESAESACNFEACDPIACATPHVSAAALDFTRDPQEAALVEAIGSTEAFLESQGSPLSVVLSGAMSWAESEASAAERDVSVVLFTDGEPSGCEEDPSAIAGIAADGLLSGVRTLVIGLEGANATQLDLIAAAGGTDAAILLGSALDVESEIARVLPAFVQGADCVFDLPPDLDPVRVNIGAGDSYLTPVSSVNDCAQSLSWYFDGPDRIRLCPTSCAATHDQDIVLAYGCFTAAP